MRRAEEIVDAARSAMSNLALHEPPFVRKTSRTGCGSRTRKRMFDVVGLMEMSVSKIHPAENRCPGFVRERLGKPLGCERDPLRRGAHRSWHTLNSRQLVPTSALVTFQNSQTNASKGRAYPTVGAIGSSSVHVLSPSAGQITQVRRTPHQALAGNIHIHSPCAKIR